MTVEDKLDTLKESFSDLKADLKDVKEKVESTDRIIEKWDRPVTELVEMLPDIKRALKLVWLALGILVTSAAGNSKLTSLLMEFLGGPAKAEITPSEMDHGK